MLSLNPRDLAAASGLGLNWLPASAAAPNGDIEFRTSLSTETGIIFGTITAYKNPDGTIRSYQEVQKRVSDQLKIFMDKFDKRGFKCASCEDTMHYVS